MIDPDDDIFEPFEIGHPLPTTGMVDSKIAAKVSGVSVVARELISFALDTAGVCCSRQTKGTENG